MAIYITRHGQTNWNVQHKVMGRIDEPLNDKGISQARQVREILRNKNFDFVISSPLARAKQTAEIIFEGRNIPIVIDARVAERDFGEMEGMNKRDFDFEGFWNYYQNNQYDKAENIQDFFQRVYDFIKDIEREYQGKDIIVVTHGGVSIPFSCYYLDAIPEGSLLPLVLDNCEVKQLQKINTNRKGL